MRLPLLAFALGALMLSGCADDLTGPDTTPLTNGVSNAAPEVPEQDPMAALFSTWTGTDGLYTFNLLFEEKAAEAAVTIEESLTFYFEGEGTYERLSQIESSSSPCRIVEGKYSRGSISFTIVGEEGVVAHAEGSVHDEFGSLRMKLEYTDGTAKMVNFKSLR